MLDEDDCIDLLTILRIVHRIDDQQAWALCHQIAKAMQKVEDCYPIQNLAQIHLHKKGYLHEKSFKRVPGLRPATKSQLVASLGIALFWALDYGIPEEDERSLDKSMEYLIYQSQDDLSLEEILRLCNKHLQSTTLTKEADVERYFSEVCKNLVSDTIELSIFLDKIYKASILLGDLDECNSQDQCDINGGVPLNDWARLWMQVIREFKQRSLLSSGD